MSKPRKEMDWWETFLWAGIFILAAMFIYQLLKLWQAGTATANNAAATVSQALTNTLASAEGFLTTLATSPTMALSYAFSFLPDFLNMVTSFISNLVFGGLWTSIFSWAYSLFSGASQLVGLTSAAPITNGLGASYVGSGTANLITSTIGSGTTNVPVLQAPSNGFSAVAP